MLTKEEVKTIAARVLRAKNLDPNAAVEQLVTAYVDEVMVGAVRDAAEELKTLGAAKRQEVKQALLDGFREALDEYAAELARTPAGTGT